MTNLVKVLQHVSGASFVGIDTCTNVPLKGGKKNPMQGRVQKLHAGAHCMIFTNSKKNGYEEMVKRRLQQEGKDPESFELKPRVWGQRIEDTPFVVHTNKAGQTKHYLEVIFLRAGKVEYLLDGKAIEKSAIQGLEVEDEEQPKTGQAGLEDQVIIRTYAVDSIIFMRAEGRTFEGPFEVLL